MAKHLKIAFWIAAKVLGTWWNGRKGRLTCETSTKSENHRRYLLHDNGKVRQSIQRAYQFPKNYSKRVTAKYVTATRKRRVRGIANVHICLFVVQRIVGLREKLRGTVANRSDLTTTSRSDVQC